jgi:hypothetical protein
MLHRWLRASNAKQRGPASAQQHFVLSTRGDTVAWLVRQTAIELHHRDK